MSVKECTLLADKGYDVKEIYNQVKALYDGDCMIPLNKQNTKKPKLLPQGNRICQAGLAMWKDSKFSNCGRTRQKFCCPLKSSKDTDFPLTETVNISNVLMHRVRNANGTIPGSKAQARNVCG